MNPVVLTSKRVAEELRKEQHRRIAQLPRPPVLAVILVGHHAPSQTYVAVKERACQELGMGAMIYRFAKTISQSELLAEIDRLNKDPLVDGILVQFPLPAAIDAMELIEAVDPKKDVDGFHPENMGKLLLGRSDGFVACTPLGIMQLLNRSAIDLTGRHVVIVGRSHVVGRPLAALLVQNRPECNATVTLAHSKTHNLNAITRLADILIVAIGQPRFITADMVREGAVVVDVGTNRIVDSTSAKGYRLVGDVDFEKVAPKCRAITPVPGGVGPMTVAMLIENTITSCERRFVR